jgi:hypothetical protein
MADDTGTTENSNSEGESTVSDAIGEAVRKIEAAARKAVDAAVKSDNPEAAQRIAAATIEGVDRAVDDLETVAESIEQVAEEVAEDATPGADAEAAEEAVEAAREAGEAVEDAEAEVREEQREQGGGEVTEAVAVDQAIHAEAEERIEERPVEDAPVVEAVEEVEQEIADVQSDAPPPVIAPEAAHPYFKKRKVKVFGKTFEF